MSGKSARQTIKRLHAIRNRYGGTAALEKQALLEAIGGLTIRSAADIRQLHTALCFLCAYPDSAGIYELASTELREFASRVTGLSEHQRLALVDAGIAGTSLHYPFSYEVASWLAQRFPGVAVIDWDEFKDPARFEELLEHLLHHSETDFYDSGRVSTEEWIKIAASHQVGNDFDWLMSELRDRRHHTRFWTSLYNAAEVPLVCSLAETTVSRTRNSFPVTAVHERTEPMQSRVPRAKLEIDRPIESIRLLDKHDGATLLDVAMASLAARHRETIHFNYANPAEIWLADVGRGIQIAATGLLPEHRYPLECTMGFLVLSNGMPIGYGGSSMLYRQANTGINIFEEYRGSEAAWLWVQVMRVFHALSGCTRFIANPYQFGSENAEALKSGAFWFYYRLGYRPVDAGIRKFARSEYAKLAGKPGYRTPVKVLRKLATCDMHLTLPGARQADFFDEGWIEITSLLATRQLAATGHGSRRRAQNALAHQLAADLDIDSMKDWTQEERRWFVRLAPVVSALNPGAWSARDRTKLIDLMHAKGSVHERDFVERFGRHDRLFNAMKKACRRAAHDH
jgi:hypothetical protein